MSDLAAASRDDFDTSDLPKYAEPDLWDCLDDCNAAGDPPDHPWRLALRAELARRGF